MKKTNLLFIVLFLSLVSVNYMSARAKIPVCTPCEKASKVENAPKLEWFKSDKGEQLHLVYLYNEYGAVWIPVWNEDGKYALANEAEDLIYDLEAAETAELKDKHKLDATVSPLSFWNKIGGKLLLVGIIGFLVWGQIGGKKMDEEVQPTSL
jgi:hypothetical protein